MSDSKIRVAIMGAAGRMGQILSRQISTDSSFNLVARIDIRKSDDGILPPIIDQLSAAPEFDILIDFSMPAASEAAIPEMSRRRAAWLVAPTGLSDDARNRILALSNHAPIFIASNTSIGIALMRHLCREVTSALAAWDIEIVETHHHSKVDAPSGTALTLAHDIEDVLKAHNLETQIITDRSAFREARKPHSIGVSSIRGGSVAGEHTAIWFGESERLEIKHTAESREIFANGARRIARWLIKKQPGIYNMQMILDEILEKI